jgi:hypothetical protein
LSLVILHIKFHNNFLCFSNTYNLILIFKRIIESLNQK